MVKEYLESITSVYKYAAMRKVEDEDRDKAIDKSTTWTIAMDDEKVVDKSKDKDKASTKTTTTTSITAKVKDKDKATTSTVAKDKSENYTKDDVTVFCKNISDWLGYHVGDINDFLTNDISVFKDSILVLHDMGDKLYKKDCTFLHNR